MFRRALVLGPIARPVDRDDMTVVEEPIQHGASDHVVSTEDRAPLLERSIARQNDGPVFVESADELEEQIRAPRVHGEIAEFVEQFGDGPKEHALVCAARADAESNAQMRFPSTRWADQTQILRAGEKPEFGEFADERGRNGRLELKATKSQEL